MGSAEYGVAETFDALRELLDRAQTLVAALDEKHRNGALLRELRNAESQTNERSLLEHVHEALAKEGIADATAVVFATQEYDDGYFFDASCAAVYLADGQVQRIGVGGMVDDVLTYEFGVVGPDAGLGVNLRTNNVEFDDNIVNVRRQLAVPEPEELRGPV